MAPKTPPKVVEPQVQDDEPTYDDEPPRQKAKGIFQSKNVPWFCLVAVLLVVGSQYLVRSSNSPDKTNDIETVDSDKSASVKAIPDKNDRRVFAKSLALLADLIEKDGEQKEPSIKTTDQVSEEIVGFVVRSFLLAGGKAEFEELKAILVEAFDEEEEFPQKAIDLDDESRAQAVTQLKLLSATFE